MTTAQVFLLLHIGGAVITGGLVVTAFVSIGQRRSSWYRPVIMALSLLTAYQLVTGGLLSWSAADKPTLFAYCRNIAAYLAVIGLTIFALARQMRFGRVEFPRRLVLLNALAGVMATLMIGAALYG